MMGASRYFIFSAVISLAVQAGAFESTDVADLKADLGNYADGECKTQSYLKSAMSIVGRLSSPVSNAMTSEETKANDQLREALSGVREALMASMSGNKSDCAQKLRAGIKKLDSLLLKETPPNSAPQSSGKAKTAP